MLTFLLVLSVLALVAYVGVLRSKGIGWDGVVCGLIGHTTPFQRPGERAFRCRRCGVAFGGVR